MTLLFTDLVGSTAMGDRLGDDDAETVRRRFFQIIEEAVEPTGGRIVKTLGDGHMVAFASALDAIGCAIAIQCGVDTYNSEHGAEQLGVRVGINAGDVTVEGEDFFGTPVTIAKRLCDSAEGGQILVSGLVESLVGSRGGFAFRTLGALELRGLSRPQAASEVVWRGGAGPAVRSASSPAPGHWLRKRVLLEAGAGVLAVVAITVIAVLALTGGDDDQPSPAAESPATDSATASGTASETASGTASATQSGTNLHLLDLTSELPTLDSSRDFSFPAEAGDIVRVDATRRQIDVDLVVELRAPDGSLIAFDDDSGPNHEPQIAAAELAADGSYSVVVRMFAPETNGGFNLTVTELDTAADVVPNRTFGEFTEAGGTFETPVDLVEGETVDIVTKSESVNVADLFLELVSPDGEVAASDDDSGLYADPIIEKFDVPTTGTWTIRIHPNEAADVGAFWVDVVR